MCTVACNPDQQQSALVFSLQESLPESLPESLQEPQGSDTQVAFFIYEIRLVDADNEVHNFLLDQSQYPDQVALIALSAAQKNFSLSGVVANKKFRALEFTVGVPHELNHANPLRAHAPLNNSAMFWSWQQGYKFLRIDGTSRQWAFHLGSTGCNSPSALQAPTEPCTHDHRVRVRLDGFDPAQNTIELNLQNLVQQLKDTNNVNCSANYQAQQVCTRLVASLGLNPASGECEDNCAAQKLFQTQ